MLHKTIIVMVFLITTLKIYPIKTQQNNTSDMPSTLYFEESTATIKISSETSSSPDFTTSTIYSEEFNTTMQISNETSSSSNFTTSTIYSEEFNTTMQISNETWFMNLTTSTLSVFNSTTDNKPTTTTDNKPSTTSLGNSDYKFSKLICLRCSHL